MSKQCECFDSLCPHAGRDQKSGQCTQKAKTVLVRVDMEDTTGTLFCKECATDALESGVFGESIKAKILSGV